MEKQKLIYVESKALFSPSEVSDKAIVFIKDTKEIWTHGVYFSCSGAWASPITLSLTGDTNGSVSIDGSGNASIATTTTYLSSTTDLVDANTAASTLWHKVAYYARIIRNASNLFPAYNNANGILSLNVHDYSYTHLLGFSSDGNIYHRRRSAGTWETTWKTILNSSNYTNFPHTFASLTNKPTTLSGYGITDCIPIISGGPVTTATALRTLGMTAMGAKLSVFHLVTGPYPTWLNVPYMNVLMFRSTSDTYGAIGIEMNGSCTVLFIGGRDRETAANNVPNWWFRIKGTSGTTYDLNSILNSINNLDSNYLKKSGGTMTGALNFANNTWNKVGDDAYIGNCNVAGMIGIKGSNAATPGFAMYNNSGTLLGKLYASGSDLYWSGVKILAASGTSTLFVMGNGSLYSDTVSHKTWTKTTTSGIAWFPIADITDIGLGTALFMVRAFAHSSIIFTVVKGYNNGNINVLAGGGQFNNNYAYIRGVRLIGTVVEIGLNAAAIYVDVVIKVLLPTFTYSLRSSLVESTSTTTPYVQYDINSGVNYNFGIISSKFTGNLIGNADTASNISTVNPILALPFEKNAIQVVSNPLGALAELLGTAAAITHALRFNWYNTAYEIGNVRGGGPNSAGFGITYGNNNLCLLVKTNGTYSPYGFIGDLIGNATSANKWATARTITLTGDVTGSVSLDGSSNVTLTTSTSGTGTTSFLKCPDKRNLYPALIVTSGGNIGAAFISTSTLGLSEGYYCDTLILRGYANHTAGYENALFFNKQNSSVYHSQYAFGSTTTWGTMYKFLDSNNYSSYALPLSGGILGSSTASFTELFIKSSTANLRLMPYSDSTNYIQSGNSAFNGNATLKITGYNNNTGSNLYFNFTNIYCRGGSYTNIDSGNYSSYALPLSGGTLTGTLISRDIRPSANVSYSLGTSSYYYNYVYAKYFKKNGSSDSYVLLGGGGHKAVSDFTMKELKTTTSISGNTDQWSIILEQSYPANHWYDVVNIFLVEGMQFGSGFLSFYAYWLTTSSAFKDYITEVYFNGTMRGETTAVFGGSNRDINDYLRIYIDKTNYKLLVYANHYNGKTVKIKRINYNEIDTSGFPNGGILVEHFNDKGTIVSLPTESSTMTRVLIKTHYNHDRTIKTSKSIYASSFYENSDIRLKENIRGIDLSDLTKLVDLVQFNFKDSDTKKYGVIAQLLELVGLQNLVYENDGKKAVDYISLLVLEIQRLRNEIGELKLEIHKKS